MKAMVAWLSKLEPKWVITNAAVYSILAVVLYFGAFYMIIPMQKAYIGFIDKQIEQGVKIVETQQALVSTQAAQTPILEDIRKNTSQQMMAAGGRER